MIGRSKGSLIWFDFTKDHFYCRRILPFLLQSPLIGTQKKITVQYTNSTAPARVTIFVCQNHKCCNYYCVYVCLRACLRVYVRLSTCVRESNLSLIILSPHCLFNLLFSISYCQVHIFCPCRRSLGVLFATSGLEVWCKYTIKHLTVK